MCSNRTFVPEQQENRQFWVKVASGLLGVFGLGVVTLSTSYLWGHRADRDSTTVPHQHVTFNPEHRVVLHGIHPAGTEAVLSSNVQSHDVYYHANPNGTFTLHGGRAWSDDCRQLRGQEPLVAGNWIRGTQGTNVVTVQADGTTVESGSPVRVFESDPVRASGDFHIAAER